MGGQDRIAVETYSTTLDVYQTDSVSQFHFDLSFADRFDAIPERFAFERSVATSGQDSYLTELSPTSNFGASSNIESDTSDGGGMVQGLLRFDIDFAALPAGADIKRAQLRVAQTDSGNGFALHRMRRAWDENSVTWDSLGAGVDTDGSDAEASADLTTRSFMTEGESLGYSLFDVTASVQAWHAGQENHGWVLRPLGSNGLVLASFQASNGFRPELIIDYVTGGQEEPPPPQVVVVNAGEDTYIWKKENDQNFGQNSRIRVDYSDGKVSGGPIMPIQGLIRFDIAGQVPAGATVQRAELRLRLTDSGHGFRMHRMLVPWSENQATWLSFGDGIDDDDVEASGSPDVITDDFLTEAASPTYLSFDVTAAVSAWQGGQANHGWVLLPLGDNKLIIESMQGSGLRPELVVEYTVAP